MWLKHWDASRAPRSSRPSHSWRDPSAGVFQEMVKPTATHPPPSQTDPPRFGPRRAALNARPSAIRLHALRHQVVQRRTIVDLVPRGYTDQSFALGDGNRSAVGIDGWERPVRVFGICRRTASAWRSALSGTAASFSYAGHVRVYAESGGTWTRWAPTSTGLGATASWVYRWTSDGKRGDRRVENSGSLTYAGHVMYAESGGTWVQVGADIERHGRTRPPAGTLIGDAARWRSASLVRQRNAGSVRVRGERRDVDPGWQRHRRRGARRRRLDRCPLRGRYNDNSAGSNDGHVRVYAESGGTWTQVGSDIDGEHGPAL